MKGFLVLALVLSFGLVRCGDDEAQVDTSFPTELSLASPLAAQAARLMGREDPPPKPGDVNEGDDFMKKKQALGGVLNPTDGVNSCGFIPVFNPYSAGRALCYGPPLNYNGHDNWTSGPNQDGQLPGGDLGIWTETNGPGGEACAAAQLNRRVSDIAKQVDSAIFSLASLPCIMNANGITLLEGTPQDLTAEIAATYATLQIDLTVNSAQVTVNDNIVLWELVTTFGGTRTVSLRLKHVDGDDGLYSGKLSYTIQHPEPRPGRGRMNCPAGPLADATSIAYEKASATEMRVQLHSGVFCGNAPTPYVSSTDFTVDPTKTYDGATTPGGWGDNFNYALFNFSPEDLTGEYQFAWQAGKGDSHARSFSVSVDKVRDPKRAATLEATAFSGYGPKMGTTGYGDIDRMICNWAGPGNDHNGVTRIQRQTMDNRGTNGRWESNGANITYAPVNACAAGGAMKCDLPPADNTDPCPTSDNLVEISSVTLPSPTAPVNVDAL